MGYLRLAHSAPALSAADSACLELFESHLDYLFQTLQRLGANPAEAEDFAQEVFLILRRNWPHLDTSRPLRPYLFAVAFRIVSAQRRRRSRETPHPGPDTEDGGIDPEESLEAKETMRILSAALDRVPLPRRAVLVMHDLDEVPVADIARKLSISRFGTYARLRKGRKELAAAIRRLSKEGVRR